jgi:hypothetical protein
VDFYHVKPQLKLRAIFIRASGAGLQYPQALFVNTTDWLLYGF